MLDYSKAQRTMRRCRCLQSNLPLSGRDWTVKSYFPRMVWGKALKKYDGRKLLQIWCNRCGATWKDYRKDSPLWGLIDDNPYEGGEKITCLGKER